MRKFTLSIFFFLTIIACNDNSLKCDGTLEISRVKNLLKANFLNRKMSYQMEFMKTLKSIETFVDESIQFSKIRTTDINKQLKSCTCKAELNFQLKPEVIKVIQESSKVENINSGTTYDKNITERSIDFKYLLQKTTDDFITEPANSNDELIEMFLMYYNVNGSYDLLKNDLPSSKEIASDPNNNKVTYKNVSSELLSFCAKVWVSPIYCTTNLFEEELSYYKDNFIELNGPISTIETSMYGTYVVRIDYQSDTYNLITFAFEIDNLEELNGLRKGDIIEFKASIYDFKKKFTSQGCIYAIELINYEIQNSKEIKKVDWDVVLQETKKNLNERLTSENDEVNWDEVLAKSMDNLTSNTNNQNAIELQTLPKELLLSGCSCLFSLNKESYERNEFIYFDDYSKTSYVMFNNTPMKFVKLNTERTSDNSFVSNYKSEDGLYNMSIEGNEGKRGYESKFIDGKIKLTNNNNKNLNIFPFYGLCGC
ncbi:MAG: hypothetical protein R2728_11525 [Chitinophagales bacterium]